MCFTLVQILDLLKRPGFTRNWMIWRPSTMVLLILEEGWQRQDADGAVLTSTAVTSAAMCITTGSRVSSLLKPTGPTKISFGGIPNSSSIDILMPYAIFDYMGGVLPMWTMVSP